MRSALFLCFFLLALAPLSRAADPPEDPELEPELLEEYDIERLDDDEITTLRFLRSNRSYLRAELDRLQSERRMVEGDARALTDRDRMLLEHGFELAAHTDSLGALDDQLARQQLMESVAELTDYEDALDEVATLLFEQQERLARLEADYVGRQETAVAMFLRSSELGETTGIVVQEASGDRQLIDMGEDARASLRAGASAQLFHDFVEPRALHYRLSKIGADGEVEELGELSLEPARNRLTLVEIDLTRPSESGSELPTVIWER